MVALFVQTLLLMAAAYFAGAALACLIRRSLFAPTIRPVPVQRTVDPLPEVAQRAAVGERFARSPTTEPRPVVSPPAPMARPGPVAAAVAAAKAERPPAQDLKRIRLIDAGIEAALNKLGVDRYEHIAGWMQPDVKRIGEALGLGGRISQENWIEQAQVLARGGETYFATRRARGESASAAPTPDEGERRPITAPPASTPTVSPRPSTGGAAGVVADVAIGAVATAPVPPPAPAPAPYTPPDVAGRAAFAAARPAAQAVAAGPAAAPTPLPRTVPFAPAEPEPAVPIRPAAPTARDNLQRISGIDAAVEAALVTQGVTRYSQIAHWSPADVERFETQLGAAGRIGRENWIEQAQILSRGGDTKYSRQYDQGINGAAAPAAAPASAPASAPRPVKLADAISEQAAKAVGESADAPRAGRSDIGSLRSVRAEVYRTAEAAGEAQRPASDSKVLRSAVRDDLKRIRGIGVLIENRLNAMGVVAYEQIANWTAADIDRVSQSLDFKGRIERENWVEQARILASGGATEFSRRVDRGEMDTGRYRR
jgi:predicted flap endonuclease-1-like 5' DNA nuclease